MLTVSNFTSRMGIFLLNFYIDPLFRDFPDLATEGHDRRLSILQVLAEFSLGDLGDVVSLNNIPHDSQDVEFLPSPVKWVFFKKKFILLF